MTQSIPKLGGATLSGRAILAPMAGVTDAAFREICRSFGAAMAVTEMVSAKALTYGDKKSKLLLAPFEGERPFSAQLFGSDPDTVAEGARIAVECVSPDLIDLNMGCPAPKITGNGEGSALMKNIPLAAHIVERTVRACGRPVTVKMRKGWDAAHPAALELARAAQESGAGAFAIHGRTRDMMYAGRSDRSVAAAVKRELRIPVVANGDVFTAADALSLLEETGADFVMVGRGALGRPWLFAEINALLEGRQPPPPPGMAERMDVLMKQTLLAAAIKGEYTACREARKHAAWYCKGVEGASHLRELAVKISSLDDLAALCKTAVESVGAGKE